jgi:hypothetical protein
MGLRDAVLMVLMAAAPLPVGAQWHTTAAAPREGLPGVEVDLGYTAGYLPATNTPVTLRVQSGERPFDGYIGYHTAVGNRRAFEMPVVARAEPRPHSQWTFSTSIRVPMGTHGWDRVIAKRELVIEWRDRGRNLLAERSIGAPPWTESRRPLRVVRPGETADANVFGQDAVLLPASSLPDQPQWYSGFSTVVLPFSLWRELPRGIHDAIFRSAVHVVLIGVPDRVPQNAAATFVADEKALRDPRLLPDLQYPDMRIVPRRISPMSPSPRTSLARRALPAAGEIFREYRPAVFFVLFAVLSVVAWLLIRRRPRILVFIAMGAVTLLAAGWRNAIRPVATQHNNEQLWIVAPGVVDRISSGELTDAGGGRVLAEPLREGDDLEVRTSQTSPGFGELYLSGRVWPMPRRATMRRELGTPATLRVRSQDPTRLVLEYDSTIPVDYVTACWKRNGVTHYGEVRAGSRRGVVTVHDGYGVWPKLDEMLYDDALGYAWIDTRPALSLIHVERDRTVVIARRMNP